MTANENTQNEGPGRPSWAAGLDLSISRPRVSDEDLRLFVQPYDLAVKRRLADAEMRVAELERDRDRHKAKVDALRSYLDQITGFDMRTALDGHPDYLIEPDGAVWQRVDEQGRYARKDGAHPGFTPDRAKIERSADGPVRAVWGELP